VIEEIVIHMVRGYEMLEWWSKWIIVSSYRPYIM